MLTLGGITAALFFVFLFDVGVSTGAGTIANMDLLNQRTNGVILSAAMALAGIVCLVANSFHAKKR
jgi:hypothetical protein